MAEIALGAVPIFFTALRGFALLQSTIHKLRHYRTDIKWLRTKVEVQASCYKGEIQWLIIDTLDKRMAQSLIVDDKHEYWQSKELADAIATHLGSLRDEFDRAVHEINKASTEIEAKLAMFAPPDVKVSSLSFLWPESCRLTISASLPCSEQPETSSGWPFERRSTSRTFRI